jgi:hypothetical protein
MDGPFTGTSPYFVYDPQKYGVTEINPMADGTIQYRDESYTDSSGKKKTNCVLTRTKCASFPDHRQEYAKKVWSIFPDEQLQAVFWFMYQWVLKHDILPENIIGHEHVTPGRKQDPGPAFPWTAWEDWLAEQLAEDRPELLDPTHRQSERIKAVQSHCARMGLAVGDIDGIWGPPRGCRGPVRQLPRDRQRPSTGPRIRPGSTMRALLPDHVLPVRRIELPVSAHHRKAVDLLTGEVRRPRSLPLGTNRRAATRMGCGSPSTDESAGRRRNGLLRCTAAVQLEHS